MNALTIENLHKTYANGHVALKGIDLHIKQGDFFALLGPNGAGKSTTIGIISSLVNKTSGLVKVFDYDIDTHLTQAKQQLGVVPQEFNFSIFEKVIDIVVNQAGYYGLPRRDALERADYYLNEVSLYDKKDDTAQRLSGGMKRRLMIARALIHNPKVLILDEPTAGVDIEIRRSMWEFLTKINEQGTTIILTTHYLEEAEQLCKNIAIIDDGIIKENSDMRSMLQRLNCQTFIFETAQTAQGLSNEVYNLRLKDDTTIEVDLRATQSLNELFEYFLHQGVVITSMRNKANRLEELFVRLTKGEA